MGEKWAASCISNLTVMIFMSVLKLIWLLAEETGVLPFPLADIDSILQ
jgi:hypothetical protein